MSKQKIKDYITQIRGVSYKPADVVDAENGTPIIRANNIQDDGMIYDDLVFVTQQRIKDNQLLKKGDIVICTSSGSKNLVGKATTFNGYKTDMSFGAFCKGVRISDSSVNPDFIRLFFKSKTYREQISASSTGANINNIKAEHIDNLLINIPPVETQNIAVGELFTLIKSISIKKQQLSALNDLVKSRFIEMFGDPEVNPHNWKKVVLSEIITTINNGMTRRGNDDDGNIVLRLVELQEGRIDYSGVNRIKLKETERTKFLLKENDFLFARVNGNPDYVGRCAVFNEKEEPIYHNDHIIRVHCKDDIFKGIFGSYLFNSDYGKSQIRQYISTSAGQFTINQTGISSVIVILPPIELQNEFADFVKLIDKSKFVCRSNPSIFCVKFLRFRHPP